MKISQTQSDFLNWSRWVAAWLVVAEHGRSMIFLDYGDGVQATGLMLWLKKAFYLMTGFGHEAVMVFFVISGYLVGGKVWSLSAQGKFGWKRYLADRTSRLYAVLFVALLLGAAMDWTGLHFFNRYGLYDMSNAVAVGAVVKPAADSLTVKDFVLNALFLQTIAGPTFGSNGPLWSLANEWWYYILFPALVGLVFRRSVTGVIASLVVAIALVWMLPVEILVLFGIWVMGVGAGAFGNADMLKSGNADHRRRWLRGGACGTQPEGRHERGEGGNRGTTSLEMEDRRGGSASAFAAANDYGVTRVLFLAVAGVVFVGCLLVARAEVLSSYWWQYLVGGAFALLLVALAAYSNRLPGSRVSAYLAEFSYSVYLTHFPALMLMVSAAFTLTGYGIKVEFGAFGLLWYAAVFATAILVAWVVSLFTEAKTPELRSKVYDVLRIGVSVGR